jgi:DNA topoisomerase-1
MQSMYKLIWKNTVESCMSTARYNTFKVQITAPMDTEYINTIDVPIFLGWKKGHNTVDVESGSQLLYLKSIKNPVPYEMVESAVVIHNKHHHYTEASLINKLENLGIGRPSTFASIIETIQERGYVKCTDLEGIKHKCIEYKLGSQNSKIITQEIEKTFGNEKQKLVIQPMGIVTIEFLLQHFESMFSYEYTKNMENNLDQVTINNWSDICKQCAIQIKELSKDTNKVTKQAYCIEEGYEFMFEKYGPTIKHKLENGEIEYLPVKKDMNIDLEKLQENKYKLEDLIEVGSRLLGKYEEKDVYIKRGKYGVYIEVATNDETSKISIKQIKKPMDQIQIYDVEEIIRSSMDGANKQVPILRQLNDDMSIRKGKFGAYVFYKRPDMKAPKFLNIKKFPEGFLGCDADKLINWLIETYNLPKSR